MRDGKIFLHQADTTLVALDAKTGKVVWQAKNGDPAKGETGTSAPMVVKDKVLVGISGGEFGVPCHVTAYNISDGKQVWRGYLAAGRTTRSWSTRKRPPNSASRSARIPASRPGKAISGRSAAAAPGAGSPTIPQLNLIYYGSGNPSTWNPKQRPGDNKWSMTIFARDADTGMAKWVYQMTPHDEWDYDGVNEMILADQHDRRHRHASCWCISIATASATRWTATNGELLVAEKYDPKVNWATDVDMDKNSPTYGRPQVVSQYSTEQNGEDVNTKGICPAALGTKDEQPAAYSPDTKLFYVPTNHVCMDYEPFKVELHRGPALRRRDAVDVSAAGRDATWATSLPGMPGPARSSGRTRSSSRCGRARSRPPAASCSTARSKAI